MKRRLAGRDRAVWLIAMVALALILYVVVPLWALVAAVVVIAAVPLIRHARRRHARR